MTDRSKALIGAGAMVALIVAGWLVLTFRHVPVRGEVVDKYVDPARTTLMPVQTSTVCSGTGTTRVCTPIYTMLPVTDDEDYVVVVRDENRDGKLKHVEVVRPYFDAVLLGELYVEEA